MTKIQVVNALGGELQRIAAKWKRKVAEAQDRALPFKARLAALHWIEGKVEAPKTPGDDLDAAADALAVFP